MTEREKLVFGIIFFLSLELNLFSAQAEDSGVRGWARTGSELRRRTHSGSGRGDSKGSESEIELITPSTERAIAKELLPKSTDILDALVAKDHVRLGRLVAKFTSHKLAKLSFPVLIPYGRSGGSSFAIYAVQTKQLDALGMLALVEDFTVSDHIGRTPMSVALELARRDASFYAVITVLEELHDAASAAR